MEAFEILAEQVRPMLLVYLQTLVRDEHLAEDLTQESLITAQKSLSGFRKGANFGAWLRGIVRMKYLEWTRSHRTEQLDAGVLDAIDHQHQTWDRAAEEGRENAADAVRTCIQKLPPHLGESLELFYRAEESCTAIAGRLHISEVVVRKRLQRARESLAECIRRRLAWLGG